MSDRFRLDPDEAHVRGLMRRSDGPVTIRPFRPRAPSVPVLRVALASLGVLALGLVLGTSLASRRQEVANGPTPPAGVAAPATASPIASATHTPAPTATPEPTPAPSGVPISAGAVPEAGALYVLGSDDLVYRYDAGTGSLTPIAGRSTFLSESAEGALVLEGDGSTRVLRWGGGTAQSACPGSGLVLSVSRSGACAYREPDGSVTITLPGDPTRMPLGMQVGEAVWDEAGSRLAFTRGAPGPTEEERGHNALWLRERDGTLRQVYEPNGATAFVVGPAWSPDGRSILIHEAPYPSSSIVRDGIGLRLVDPETGSVADLGTTLRPEWASWSPSGALAFVRGAGRETWMNKRLVLRSPDGSEREVALPDADHVQLAPAWSAAGDLAFVVGPAKQGPAEGYMEGVGIGDRRGLVVRPDGSSAEIRCPERPLEGIRPSADGRSFLLLCREPGNTSYPLSLWFLDQIGAAPVQLIRGLGQPYGASGGAGIGTGGFGYYGLHPHLETITAWSRATR